jgi:acyl-coenzyme A thioesterase PaaI-like protein
MLQNEKNNRQQDQFSEAELERNRSQTHAHCMACSPQNPSGLQLKFKVAEDGSVSSHYLPGESVQGYDGLVHGGIIATLLDAVMTNCLFAHGNVALTAELVVRYRKAVQIGEQITIRGWIENSSSVLYCTKAELVQKGEIKVVAKAKFLKKPQQVS